MKNRRVSFADIAEVAGVDKSTVSLVMSGHPRISEATRKRVSEAAAELGYVPDPALASLAASRWQGRRDRRGLVLAFVCDDIRSAEPELHAYLAGVRRQAGLLGYGVEVFSLADYPSAEVLLRVIRQRGLRGMVIGQSRQDLPDALLTANEPPRVHCGFLREISCDTVRPDLAAAVNLAWRHLGGGGGGRRVVFGLELERGLHSDLAILGAARALSEVSGRTGPRVIVSWKKPDRWQEEGGADFVDRLKKAARLDALVVINAKQRDRLREIGELERVLPLSVPIVPLHLSPMDKTSSGVDLRLEDTGRVAVNFLELKMRRLPLASAGFYQRLEVEPRWVELDGITAEM